MSAAISHEEILKFFQDHRLMAGLTHEEVEEILPFIETCSFNPGSIIFKENEMSNDLYIILEGGVVLLKNAEDGNSQFVIEKLKKGEVFGEMSFIDDSPRSCAVVTNHDLILLKLSRIKLETSLQHIQKIYAKFLQNITKIIVERLRKTNERIFRNEKAEIIKLLTRNEFGILSINLLFLMLLSAGVIATIYLKDFGLGISLVASWTALFCLCVYLLFFAKRHEYPLKNFSLAWGTWNVSLRWIFFGVLLSIAHIYLSFGKSTALSLMARVFLLAYPVYVFFSEFVVRAFQASIQNFFTNYSSGFAVFYTAIIIALGCNFYYGFPTAVGVLCTQLVCGAAYQFKRNLFVVTAFHLAITFILKYYGLLPFAFLT